MGSKYEKIGKNKVRLEFEIESSLVDEQMQAAYIKNRPSLQHTRLPSGKSPQKDHRSQVWQYDIF